MSKCKICFKSFKPSPNSKGIYCSRTCYKKGVSGKNSRLWKRGWKVSTAGYKLIYMPDYPFRKKNGYVYEHRFVMENFLGRPLNSKEQIHHLNHDKFDNRIENLHLCSMSEHAKIHNSIKPRNSDGTFTSTQP